MRTPMKGFAALLLCVFFFSIFVFSSAVDTITTTQSLRDGDPTIVSADGTFELGFFSPGNSRNRYLGIWYKKVSPVTAVWVANRGTPLADSSGVLNITEQGILVLRNRTDHIIWFSNSSRSVHAPVAQLLRTGNFVVRDGNDDNPENFLWQSFDDPSDALVPGAKLGINRITGLERYLSSWKSPDDPSQGDYTLAVDPHRFSELVLRKSSVIQAVTGPWNGFGFGGTTGFGSNNPLFKHNFVFNQNEMYYSYQLVNTSQISRLVLNQNGLIQHFMWFDRTQGWVPYITISTDNCFQYAACGPYGSCNIKNLLECECLKGFVPKSPKDWDTADWSNGCVRKTPLDCKGGDGFLKYSGMKLPDALHYWYNKSMNLEECKMACLKNCSCTAYANSDIRGGSGCLIWFDELINTRVSTENEQDVYVRVAASERDQNDSVKQNNNSNRKKRVKIIVSSMAVIVILLLCLPLVLYVCRRKQRQREKGQIVSNLERENKTDNEKLELPLFELATIANATDNFSIQKKLGEGGFGPVYKGVLEDGQEIAVKRLSESSNQGLDEFKNEVIHIAKLQHRNLVKLLGCCIQGNEKMLVYEYMPNSSLDAFIFDQTKSMILDWPKRFHVINGIARGLLYLHQDSRLRIIHRDLKASNILLDSEMNPKISDFGMARSFGGNEIPTKTKRVVGTYGYMSPEYAIDGLYSTKSDVFSFGVLILEIVSGKRNRGFHHPDHNLNLLGHAWNLYMESKSLDLVDEALGDSWNPFEVLRSIHLGLLCVQRNPEDRPSMSSVVLILGSDGALLPPKQPGFFTERNFHGGDSSSSNQEPYSANKMTITLLEAR